MVEAVLLLVNAVVVLTGIFKTEGVKSRGIVGHYKGSSIMVAVLVAVLVVEAVFVIRALVTCDVISVVFYFRD